MKRLIRLLVFLFSIVGITQELPPVVSYTTADYGADNQNWMISQSGEKYIYAANNIGLLEFNGANWSLYPSPNETIIRSVQVVDNRIYSGCYMDFGYWRRSELGVLQYTSLVQRLNVDMIVDEQIWNIIPHDRWVLFQSLNRIYIYNTENDTISFIDGANTITKLFKLNDELFYQVVDHGLYTIENNSEKLVSDHPVLRENILVNLFKLNDKTTIITESNGFYHLNGTIPVKWNIPADSFLDNLTVYRSTVGSDGRIYLAVIANGLIALSSEGELIYQMDQSDGLVDNTALSIFEDAEKNIWLGLDNGISCINTEAPYTNYQDQGGRLGTIYASAVHKNSLYLGTNQGLFYKPLSSDEEFAFVDGTQGPVWNLKVIDESLFCGHNSGTFLVDGGNAELIALAQGTWDIKKVPGRDDMLIQGNYDGLHILTLQNGNWVYRNKITGFSISSRFFEVTANQKILVSHEYKGVYQLDVNESFTTVHSFSEVNSIEKGAHSSLTSFNNDIFYAYRQGLFKFNTTEGVFKKDADLSSIFSNDEYLSGKLITDKTGKLWVFTRNFLIYITRDKLSNTFKVNRISIPVFQRSGLEGYENITHLYDNIYLLGTSNGYLLINLSRSDEKQYDIYINKITSGKVNGTLSLQDQSTPGQFQANENYIAFEYNTPEFDKFHTTEYQYQLQGIHDQWSPWSAESHKSFDNLPHGEYEFKVRSRVSDRISQNTASYSFEIRKPWYLSNLAVATYAAGFILLFVAINGFYRRYYRKQQQRLLDESEREMELKELASQKEIIQLKNQHLNQDIESRNRELAVSTMNMIRKNRILNEIKTELETVEDLKKVKNVIKVINKNLNNEEDWQFFEEAFNHADKDFFKKVKKLHPELTPNDLRLCVYLRLNLSSKEIAPLLNISPRSVEIKRYRLRKKIDLPREKNLNDYFISL